MDMPDAICFETFRRRRDDKARRAFAPLSDLAPASRQSASESRPSRLMAPALSVSEVEHRRTMLEHLRRTRAARHLRQG